MHSPEVEILCEFIKYAYYQTDNNELKEHILLAMKQNFKNHFLTDIRRNLYFIDYFLILEQGYMYERFFSLHSLKFVYGDNLPKRIVDKTYFPHEVLVKYVWSDTNENAYNYFRVMFHKLLRTAIDTHHNEDTEVYHKLIEDITKKCKNRHIISNAKWITDAIKNERFDIRLYNSQKKLQNTKIQNLRRYIPFITINYFFILVSLVQNNIKITTDIY